MVKSISTLIKSKANQLGFQKVGIAKAESTPEAKNNLDQWLKAGRHSTMGWVAKRSDERGDIHTYFPQAKSVISVGMNYFSGHSQADLNATVKFSNYAWGNDYHDILKKKLFQLLAWLKEEYPDMKGLACVDTSPVMDKVWAQKAGLGWQGKHTNLITRDYGSWLFLGELIVDIELVYDPPFDEDLCGTCSACIDACPTRALDAYQIDSGKCISYRTIEHRGTLAEGEDDLEGWIYGCDICQEVCPWNQKFGRVTDEPAFHPRQEILEWTDKDWGMLDENGFRKLFKGSAVKRTKFVGLNRNINLNM
ncbi:tRNA epoxyqueuosine(34) reductase QueG [Caldithrix abyssi]|nr:tRNA epoxyqueuosine(34) reductase QueG [Caldithrix abyssi]